MEHINMVDHNKWSVHLRHVLVEKYFKFVLCSGLCSRDMRIGHIIKKLEQISELFCHRRYNTNRFLWPCTLFLFFLFVSVMKILMFGWEIWHGICFLWFNNSRELYLLVSRSQSNTLWCLSFFTRNLKNVINNEQSLSSSFSNSY